MTALDRLSEGRFCGTLETWVTGDRITHASLRQLAGWFACQRNRMPDRFHEILSFASLTVKPAIPHAFGKHNRTCEIAESRYSIDKSCRLLAETFKSIDHATLPFSGTGGSIVFPGRQYARKKCDAIVKRRSRYGIVILDKRAKRRIPCDSFFCWEGLY